MAQVLVLYDASYGHIEIMAQAEAEGADGSRKPSPIELEAARFQGGHVARIAAKLTAATEDTTARQRRSA